MNSIDLKQIYNDRYRLMIMFMLSETAIVFIS